MSRENKKPNPKPAKTASRDTSAISASMVFALYGLLGMGILGKYLTTSVSGLTMKEAEVSTKSFRRVSYQLKISVPESAQLIGPLRSLLWLGGYDEIVTAIDDPAYVLKDEIRVVPQGTGIGWLVDRDFEEEKVPRRLYDRLMGFDYDSPDPVTIMPARVSNVPGPVSDTLATYSIRDLYPLSRPQCLPESIQCVKFTRDRDQNRLLSKIRQSVGNLIDADNLWFRGMSFSTLVPSLAFFIPVLHSQNIENEFGPGIYATNSFRYALDYAGNNGAVMVFQAPDLRNIDLWEPSPDEWSQVVVNWLPENPLPDRFREADLMRGPISRSRLDVARHNRLPDRSNIDQIVAVSYAGCAALAKSLSMIIYLES